MKQEELNEILRKHKLWLEEKEGGKRANLYGADLREADLHGANLYGADLREADLREANLYGAYLYGADLRWADLHGADLHGANLYGADLDFSCLPLRCGGLNMKIDRRIAAQIAYHFCYQDCDDPDYIKARNAILDFANSFHRAEELKEQIK